MTATKGKRAKAMKRVSNKDIVKEDEQVCCWDDALAAEKLPRLFQDAKALWDLHGGEKGSAQTFWLGHKMKPRCLLEATALQIAEFHMEGAAFRGVEFWTRWHGSDEKVDKQLNEFHTDNDVVAFHSKGLWTHPAIATATYLTSVGAPLVICQIDNSGGDSVSCSGLSVCFPVAGRHVAFEGSLLHGVPADKDIPAAKAHERRRGHQRIAGRLSLLVNMWLGHKPHSRKQLTPQDLRGLGKGRGAFELKPEAEETPRQALATTAKGRHVRNLVLVDGLAVPIPLDKLRRAASKTSPPVIRLLYKQVRSIKRDRTPRRSR